jgi:hypothetical protein
MASAGKQEKGCGEAVLAVARRQFPSAGLSKSGTGLTNPNAIAITGGKMKLNGIGNGKIIFLVNIRKSDTKLKMANGILPM